MTNPASIALRLRAFLLTGLLCWLLGAPQCAAATPRTAVVRPTSPLVAQRAWPVATDARQDEYFAASDCGHLRLGLLGVALLPPEPGYELRGSRAKVARTHTVPSALPVLPWLRDWLRASVSPNAP
ncbi:hypothetical protein LGH74_10265 [Hymenobacter sp. BT178]|uniref:Uncharacterized protein n=1 Tax=Hymenobacter lucidus TaxID=2880930 RepID=A0ABS8ATI5_9BACT|nr:hypothetical protein [Hymenobacter lucidus]